VAGEGEEKEEKEKLASSLSRTRRRVYELAVCNEWDWFGTFTVDAAKHDRSDLGAFRKQLAQWLRNFGKRNGCKVRYLLVPELHKDGENWHMHGLLAGLPPRFITDFEPGKHPQKLIDGGYKNWPQYAAKFGFCSLGAVRCGAAVSGYLLKYLTKDLAAASHKSGAHLYYASYGLQGAECFAEGGISAEDLRLFDGCYENEYLMIQWFDEGEELPRLI